MSAMQFFTVSDYYLTDVKGRPTSLEERVVEAEEMNALLPFNVKFSLGNQPRRVHYEDTHNDISYQEKERMGYWPNFFALKKLFPFLENHPGSISVNNFGPAGDDFQADRPCILSYNGRGAGSKHEWVEVAQGVAQLLFQRGETLVCSYVLRTGGSY